MANTQQLTPIQAHTHTMLTPSCKEKKTKTQEFIMLLIINVNNPQFAIEIDKLKYF